MTLRAGASVERPACLTGPAYPHPLETVASQTQLREEKPTFLAELKNFGSARVVFRMTVSLREQETRLGRKEFCGSVTCVRCEHAEMEPVSSVVSSLQERFCATEGCAADEFLPRVFRAVSHWPARMFGGVVKTIWPEFFAPEHELLSAVAEARSLRAVNEAIRDYIADHRHTTWLRRRLGIRISTRRLRGFARRHLAA